MFQLLCDCIPLICKASKPKSYVFWFCAFRHWQYFSDLFESHGFDVMNKPIIWVRASLEEGKIYPGACPSPSKWPASNTDCCLFAHRDGFLNKQGKPDAIIAPPLTGNEKDHAVQKPVEVMLWLLDLCCIDIVSNFIVDPFMGSGTSLVAAIRKNPQNEILGFDQNPQCIEIAKGRLIAERMVSK
jgi:DNA modification methylase